MIVLACHIPFIFYMGKEGLLIIIDEIDRKSISSALVLKLQANKMYSVQENAIREPPNPDLPLPSIELDGNPCRQSYTSILDEEIRKTQANNDEEDECGSPRFLAKQKSKAIMSVVSTAKA